MKYWEQSGSPKKSPVKLMSYTNYFELQANVFLATSLDAPATAADSKTSASGENVNGAFVAPEEQVKNDEKRLAMLTLLGVVELLAQKAAYFENGAAAAKALFRDVAFTLQVGADGGIPALTSVLRKSEWNSFLTNLNSMCDEGFGAGGEGNRNGAVLSTTYDVTELP